MPLECGLAVARWRVNTMRTDRLYVWVDTDEAQSESSELISEMRGRIEDLRTQLEAERKANEENRRIIAALSSRIPELEAPRDERESPESGAEDAGSGDVPQDREREPLSVPGGAGSSETRKEYVWRDLNAGCGFRKCKPCWTRNWKTWQREGASSARFRSTWSALKREPDSSKRKSGSVLASEYLCGLVTLALESLMD
jgi:hypothetical protein